MWFLARQPIFTSRSFVIIRMEFKLFPAMRSLALATVRTALVVICNIILRVPLGALLGLIEVEMPLSSKILPVVSIDAG